MAVTGLAWKRLATRGVVVLAAMLAPVAAWAQASYYAPSPQVPAHSDFVVRVGNQLQLIGKDYRFGGAVIDWLGVRSDSGRGDDARYPTEFERRDAMTAMHAIGARVIRAPNLAGSVGCAACIEPSLGIFNEEALHQLDLTLKLAADQGLKVILPLSAPPTGAVCGAAQPWAGSICTFVAWRGRTDAASFFTDLRVRSDFKDFVNQIIGRTNSLTGIAYKDDPTIIAYENCDGCAGPASHPVDPMVASAWIEDIGLTLKATDPDHPYANGAFAGRLTSGLAGGAVVGADRLDQPSVDIVVDTVRPSILANGAPPRTDLMDIGGGVGSASKAGKVYIVGAYGWSTADWRTGDQLQAFLDQTLKAPAISGAALYAMQGHADTGGFLTAPMEGSSAYYFPGIAVGGQSQAESWTRSRLIRTFNFSIQGVSPSPAFAIPPRPEAIAAIHGLVTWRGSAGSVGYSIERATDEFAQQWQNVCFHCVDDTVAHWQDRAPLSPIWYRIIPIDLNNHAGPASKPIQNK